jgi:UDP-N-acetylmuramate dehydrogenase
MSFDIEQASAILSPHFRDRLRRQEPLAAHSAFGVGGPADIWLPLATPLEMETLVRLCATHNWPLLLVGAGRNCLFADAGVRGIVARLDLQHYEIEDHRDGTATLIADSGVRWSQLLQHLHPLGWAGLEFGIGIPGTLGAGLISNAGAHNQDLGQALEWIEVLDARHRNIHAETDDAFVTLMRRRYRHDELDLGYRHSRFRVNLSTHLDRRGKLVFPPLQLIEPAEIVMTLGLRLHHEDPQQLAALSTRYVQDRRVQEPPLPKTGPVFKDPPDLQAKELIAQADLRGKRLGGAQISEQNANYIINTGTATANDILALIIEAHQRVLERDDIELVLNLEVLGEWPGREERISEVKAE